MPKTRTSGAPIRLALAFLLCSATASALAQYPSGATVQPLPRGDDPAELLAQALRTLATEPGNVPALIVAGRNALVLGDPNAAVGFFGRAGELAPRDGQVKAGLGSALVQLEKPADALRLFGEASALGVPDADIAEDRGLAYDLSGDNRRAQRDYATVLAAHPDDDTARRRLALSQGIVGDKAAALATLDPLIRKRDIAGWRAQTFVLAMTGDASGASAITHIMMPQQADKMQPFLVRLATLSPADKARAVHFGEMPQTGAYTLTQLATTGAPATYAPGAASAASDTAAAKRPRRRTQLADADATGGDAADGAGPAETRPAPKPIPVTPPVASRALVAAASPVSASAETVAVTRAATATAGSRLAGPPAAPPAPPPARTEIAMASTPAPLAATAFGMGAAPSPAVPPATVAPAPLATQVVPAQPVPAPAPPAPTEMLPVPAPAGHFDLPHDATSAVHEPAPTSIARPQTSPATSLPPAPKAETMPESAPARRKPSRGKTPDAAPAPEEDIEAGKGRHPGRNEEEDVAAAKTAARGKAKASGKAASDDAAPAGDEGRTAKGRHRGDADESPPAKGKRTQSRKGKADADTTADVGGKSGKSRDSDDAKRNAKSRKGGARSDDDDGGGKTRGKSVKSGKGDESAAPKVYVQVAGGANKDDMDKAWAGVKKKAPDLMKGHTPSTTPLHATNRLLVGPFKDEQEAQAFVNKMAGKGLSGFTFKSSKGQKVAKVDSGK
ncbi:MAG TPA: SPOR domain-containing protein [Sphingomonas sp.]